MITPEDVYKWAKKVGSKKAVKVLMGYDISYSMAYKLIHNEYKHEISKFYQGAIRDAMNDKRAVA
jgi:hypothetical protein